MMNSILKLHEVTSRTGKSRSSIYESIAEGDFPKPVKIGERAVGWVEAEVDAWVKGRIEARDRVAS